MSPRVAAAICVGAIVLVAGWLAIPVPDEIRVAPFDAYGQRISDGAVPYRDFSLEYPPGAILVIAAPAVVPASYDTGFRALQAALGVVTLAGVFLLLRHTRPGRLAFGFVAVGVLPLLLGPVVFARYDFLPAALVVWSLVAFEARRFGTAGLLIGSAIAAKTFAAVLVLPLAAIASTRAVKGGRKLVAWSVLAVVGISAPFALLAPGGVAYALQRQLERGLQLESTAASAALVGDAFRVLDVRVMFASGAQNVVGTGATVASWLSVLLGLGVVTWLSTVVWRGRERLDEPRTAAAAIVAVVIVTSKVLSPQFLVWLLPLVAVTPGPAGVVATCLVVVAGALTGRLYPAWYEELVAKETGVVALLVLRNTLLVLAAVVLCRALVLRATSIAAGPVATLSADRQPEG